MIRVLTTSNADFASSKVTDRSSLSSFEFIFSSSMINAAFSGQVLAVNPLCDGFWVCRIFGCILIFIIASMILLSTGRTVMHLYDVDLFLLPLFLYTGVSSPVLIKSGTTRLIRSLKKFIFRYQYLVEIYSVSAEKIISDAFSYSENV